MGDIKWLVHTGHPSWHQMRAGHVSEGVTVFYSQADAERYLANFKAHHPDKPAWIQAPKED